MELVVKPEDLHAAAVALAACAQRLEDARARFVAEAARDVPELGREAVEAAATSVRRANQAVATLGGDVEELARALRLLAHVYAEVDRRAVHP